MNDKSFRNRVILINRFIKISKRYVDNDFYFFLSGNRDVYGHWVVFLKTGESLNLGYAGNDLVFD